MRRLTPIALIAFVIFLLSVLTASATTYYIAANGSDSNNGTAKNTAWQHAPGMPSCSATCASTTPQAGDQFIFRGGDSWHRFSSGGTGGTPVGLPWTWTWGGTGANPVYIGVDQTWYTGSSWRRPILTEDNPTSTSFVSGCAHNEYSDSAVSLNSVNYVTFDNFEFTGLCWQQPPTWGGATYFTRTGNYITISNSYFHGWTETNTPGNSMDWGVMITGAINAGQTHNVISYNVIDGSDSHCAGPNDCTGWGLYADAYDVHHNVIRNIANGFNTPYNMYSVHDNLFEDMYESFDSSAHGGVFETGGSSFSAPDYFYNNVLRNLTIGVTLWPEPMVSVYAFNNIFWGNGNSVNCFMLDMPGGTATQTDYFYNNTWDAPCAVRYYAGHSGQQYTGTSYYSNNHFVGYGSSLSSTYIVDGGASTNIHDNGSELYQSESTANNQGYSNSNNYAPTSSGGATVGTGTNGMNFCNSISDATVSTACKLGSTGAVSYNSLTHTVVPPSSSPAPRPTTGAWDVGAYQYGPGTTNTTVNPPSNLSAVVQ